MAEQLISVEGRRLRLSNLEKVLYPQTGTTKGEVIAYFTRIAPVLIPHLAGRPVTRIRWPDGVGTAEHPGPSFFAKDLERGAPAWIPRRPIDHSTGAKDYPLVSDAPTLVYLAQVASLELHVPQWRFAGDGARENPDRLVLDLDPGPGIGLAECAQVARWARAILTDMGLDPVPVTSGSKGIHLYAALPGTQTSDQISAVARELARAIEADHPDLVVSQMAKTARAGRVFIDWSQNNGSKTTIAPYSLRGRPAPTVAAPRTWAELDEPGLRQLLFTEVLDRVDAQGDPMTALGYRAGARGSAEGPLAAYIAKRSAHRTPEPVPNNALGAQTEPGALRFVIQEHHASRLHWDLRLERDGVLVSWAVPRGLPPIATRNSLAVMTENHPIEYLDFAGEIPRGQYGAGSMTVWDTGTYDLEKWRDDEVIFTLHGRSGGPTDGVRFALIRTDGSGGKSTWLLHRMKSDAAGRTQPDGEVVRPREAPTLASAQSLPRADRLRPMLATGATLEVAREAARRAIVHGEVPWVELKWDGIRAIGVWNGTRLRLFARSGTDITDRYPELSAVDAGFGALPAVLDGEIVALDAQGRPSFARLQQRMHLTKPAQIAAEARRTPAQLYLFDLLEIGDIDLASRPLFERRARLEEITASTIGAISVPPVFDDVDATLAASREFGLEGIVVKLASSTYRRGFRSEDWLKVKLTQTREVVIGAIRPGKGARAGRIGSLLLGIPSAQGLRYAGRVGSGFTDATLARLDELLAPLRSDQNPLRDVPEADSADALWVRPDLVAEVEFAEMSDAGILRHARWRGLRPDKTPDDIE